MLQREIEKSQNPTKKGETYNEVDIAGMGVLCVWEVWGRNIIPDIYVRGLGMVECIFWRFMGFASFLRNICWVEINVEFLYEILRETERSWVFHKQFNST